MRSCCFLRVSGNDNLRHSHFPLKQPDQPGTGGETVSLHCDQAERAWTLAPGLSLDTALPLLSGNNVCTKQET